jgi:hypothetical protein
MSISFDTAFNSTFSTDIAQGFAAFAGAGPNDPPKQAPAEGYKWEWQEPDYDDNGKRVGNGQWLQVLDETVKLPKVREPKEYNGKQDQ